MRQRVATHHGLRWDLTRMTTSRDGPRCDLRIEESDGILTVGLEGELDLATAPMIGRFIDLLIDPGCDLRLDLESVTFIDASGVGVLLELAETATARGGDLRLTGVGADVERVFDLAGVRHALPLGG
jgi:anti-anti-sigma factor